METAAAEDRAVLEQLDRILQDARFARAPILSRLLKYIVEETVAGRGEGLKEYVLGVEACGRPPAYDPRTDPIVRVQTREVRRRLAEYYETVGRTDRVIIEVPKGRYVATVTLAENRTPSTSGGHEPLPVISARQGLFSAWALVGSSLSIVLLIIIWVRSPGVATLVRGGAAAPSPPSVAVLPFQNLGHDPDDTYLSEGLTEEIIGAAAHVDGLRVLGRTSVFRFDRATQDELEMARQLKVDAIVAGSVRREGTRVRIAARLVRSSDGALLWSETFDGDHAQLLDVQERIAQAIADALVIRLPRDTHHREASTRDPEARMLYLKGRYFWNKRTGDGVRRAIDSFEQAVARDPLYAQAFAGLAEAHIMSVWYAFTDPAQAVPRGKKAAEAAVRLQPKLAEAQAALGSVRMMEWDWNGATRALEEAIALDPDYPRAHHLYAYAMLLLEWDPLESTCRHASLSIL